MKYHRAIIISTMVLLTSCVSITPLYFDELMPAELTIDRRVAKVGLINISAPQRDKNHFIVFDNRKPYEMDSLWNDQFSDLVIESFHNDLLAKNFFDSVWVDTLHTNLNKKLINNTLSYILDSIATENDLNGIFFISKTNYQTILHLEPLYEAQLWGYFQGNSAVNLGFYNAITAQFEDNIITTDTLYMDGQTGTIEQLRKTLPLPKDFATLMAKHLGEKMENRYVPYWQRADRMLYNGGSYNLNEANKFVVYSDWANAVRVWRYAIEKGNRLEKARSAYNLAVMAEMQGDIKSAKEWLEVSKQNYTPKHKNQSTELKSVESYLNILTKRERDLIKLSTQIDTTK